MKTIIFEGIDKVGKTTTIKRLSQSLEDEGYKIVKLNLPFELSNMDGELINARLKMSTQNILQLNTFLNDDYVCLIDRHHLSENVFGSFFGRKHNRFLCNCIDYKMKFANGLLVYIEPDNCLNNFNKFKKGGQLDGFNYKEYKYLYQQFNKEFDDSVMNKIKTSTSKLPLLDNRIRNWLSK